MPNSEHRGLLGLATGIIAGQPITARIGNIEGEHRDPFMAAEGARAAAAGKRAAKQQEVKGEFQEEVPAGGGTLDFDVKASASAAGSPGR